MKYDWILFDADETLFSFNSYQGLKPMLKRYGIDFTEQDYDEFQAVNKQLWVAYQNKEITAEDLRRIRFEKLSQATGRTPEELNAELMAEMAVVSLPLENVIEMLQTLQGKVKMGIITNGFAALQLTRLKNTNTEKFFEFITVSEEAHTAKPDPKIFEVSFTKMGEFEKSRVLMVGDTLASDILGGQNVGIDTCWFNHAQAENNTAIQPTYEIHAIAELVNIVKG